MLILFGGNISAICAGLVSTIFSDLGKTLGVTYGMDPWHCSLLMTTAAILVSGIFIIGIFRWLHARTLRHKDYLPTPEEANAPKIKMSMRKNFRYLAQSKYLLFIATIVVTYNICINLTEVVWKDQLHQIYTDTNSFNSYMGKVTMWVGILATVIAIVMSALIRRLNWTFNAMIPPFILLITGLSFFSFLIFKDSMLGLAIASFLGSTPLALGVFFGSVQQCLSRASKYTIFDATKELAFIPLSKESKLKGKAAILYFLFFFTDDIVFQF